MTDLPPFYCPVCEQEIAAILLWEEPQSRRIRIFCEDCSRRDEYRSLPEEQRTLLDLEGFQRFAAGRLLAHVLEKEREKREAEANQRTG
jgi:hypothetical protein